MKKIMDTEMGWRAFIILWCRKTGFSIPAAIFTSGIPGFFFFVGDKRINSVDMV